jgi:hypothetical protein
VLVSTEAYSDLAAWALIASNLRGHTRNALNVANINASKPVIDFSDQPLLIALDIENRPFADGIRDVAHAMRKVRFDRKKYSQCGRLTSILGYRCFPTTAEQFRTRQSP